MPRETDEWIGATDDTPVPPRVKVRVFERYHGRCYLSDRPIRAGDAWEVEHVIALANGGENRESNLAPALKDKHTVKTKADMRVKKKITRQRQKNLGVAPGPRQKIASRGFRKDIRRRMDGRIEPR